MICALEFRLYNADATDFRLLSDFITVAVDVKYNDVGAFQMQYPLDSDPDTKLKGALELGLDDQALVGGVAIFDDGSSIEFERYVLDSTSDTAVVDGARVRTLTGRSSLALLEDAFVYPSNWPVSAPSGHKFVNASLGTIFRTLIARAQERGCFPLLNEGTFTASSDSTGSPWALTVGDQDYSNGVTYLQIAQDFMNRGLADMKMEGWTLLAQNGGSMGRHIPIGLVEVRPAKNVTEMTRTTDSTESVSTVLIGGEEGVAIERHNSGAQALIGRRRERYVSQGGISDAGTLTILADAELELKGKIPSEETVGIISGGNLTPFKDFETADWLWVRYEGTEAPVERRVRQIALSVDQHRNLTVGVTLNSIIFEQEVRLQRKIDGYAGSGGSYGPTPIEVDNTTPNAPSGLSVQSSTFVSTQGDYVAAVAASWAAPTTNIGGSALTDLSGYELTWKYSTDAAWSFIHSSDDTIHQWSPVAPGRPIDVRVRSVDTSGHRSSWSPTVTHTVAVDETAPPTPSKPLVAPRYAAVLVDWDGFGTVSGTAVPMPLDLDRVEIWKSAVSGFQVQDSSSSLAGTLTYGGGEFYVSAPFDVSVFIRLVAVDKAGNRSEGSEQSGAIPSRIGTPDVDPATKISDGIPPDTSPTPTVIGGIGILSIRWDAISNHDPVNYDVHISANGDFIPTPATRALTTSATMATIRALPGAAPDPGADDLRNLQYNTDYFVKIVAFDVDGAAPAGFQDSGQMFQVDSPDIRNRSIVTEHMQANSVTAELLAGELVLGSSIKTATNGQRVEMDVDGVRLYGPTNSILVNLPTIPGAKPTFNGDIVAESITVENGLVVRSTNSEIAASGGLKLAAGVSPPINAPQFSIEYENFRPDLSQVRASTLGSFALNPNEVSSVNYNAGTLEIYQLRPNGTRAWFFDMTGAPLASTAAPAAMKNYPWWEVRGVVQLVGFTWTLYRDLRVANDIWYIQRTNGVSTTTNKYTRLNPSQPPRLGTNGTQLFVAETHPTNNQLHLRFMAFSNINLANSAVTSTTVSSSSRPVGGSMNAVLYGNFDYGSPRYIVSLHQNGFNYRTMLPNGTWGSNEDWESPVANRRGMIWDGTQFWTYGSDNVMYKHTNYKWTSESSTWWGAYSWYDSDPTGGLHETQVGEMSSLVMKKRARLRVTFPAIPDHGGVNDPDQWRFYLTRSSTPPASTALFFQAGGNTSSALVTTPLFSGAAPPITNNFPDGAAGWFRSVKLNTSALPQFEVDGLAVGRWGALNFRASGKVETTQRIFQQGHEDWTDLVLQNSWTNYNTDYADPGFILEVGGFVSLRGMVRNGTSPTAIIATLPNLLPALSVRPPGRHSQASMSIDGVILIIVNTDGQISASGANANVTWIDLNGVRFSVF